jgi:hypothetical protein
VYIERENGGAAPARNTAIRAARGDYLAFLDGDDLWDPTYLAVQLNAFRDDPSLDLHYLDALLIGNSPLAGRTFMDIIPSVGPATLDSILNMKCTAITSCVVVRREAVMKAGCFDESLQYSEDFELWVRLVYQGARLGYKRQVLASHRLHEGSLTTITGIGVIHGQLRVYQNLSKAADLSAATRAIVVEETARARAYIALEEGKQCFLAGDYKQAATSLARANTFYNSRKILLSQLCLRSAPWALRSAYPIWLSLVALRKRLAARFIDAA